MQKISFVVQTPFTERDYKRFGVDLLLNRGIEIDILDLTEIINPSYSVSYEVNDACKYERMVKIRTINEFESYVRQNPKTIYLDFVRGRATTYFVYRIFNKYNCSYAVFMANTLPEFPYRKKTMPGLFSPVFASILFNKMSNVIYSISDKMGLLKRPDYIIVDGINRLKCSPSIDNNTRTIYAHTLDYDNYLDYVSKDAGDKKEEHYAVFMDEYFPLHPDYLIWGRDVNPYRNNPGSYFEEMKQMFKVIEKEMGMPIVIAAHPRSKYDEKEQIFGDRKIVKGDTAGLVAKAKNVLLHSSTSINYPVLFKKPMLFLLPHGIKESYYEAQIRGFADLFGVKPYTGDANEILSDLIAWPAEPYNRYKEYYIKSKGSPEKYFWDIVADAIIKKTEC